MRTPLIEALEQGEVIPGAVIEPIPGIADQEALSNGTASDTRRQVITVAPRAAKPAMFSGSDLAWRTLCDLYPAAETPEIIMAVVEYCAARRLDPFKKPCTSLRCITPSCAARCRS